MAFIDEFNKLIVSNGQQQKIANKDKAIIDLANEVAQGGGGQTKRIVSGWKMVDENIWERIEKEVGEELYKINTSSNDKLVFAFTTDENEPLIGENTNIALYVYTSMGSIVTSNNGIFASIESESQSEYDGAITLLIPDTTIRVIESLEEVQPYLTITFKNE